jgi:hypothetical protein
VDARAAFWQAIGNQSRMNLFVAARLWCGEPSFGEAYCPRVHSGGWVQGIPRDQSPRGTTKSVLGDDDRLRTGADTGLRLEDCRSLGPGSSSFHPLVTEAARRVDVAPRALAVRALLHLPRVASHEGRLTRRDVQRELKVSADRLHRDVRAARDHVSREAFDLGELLFEKVDSSHALPILTLLHYLRSARPGSQYFALVDPLCKLPVALCSLSPLQWKCVGNHITSRFAIPSQRIWDVSRVYAVDTAPHNAISTLLSKVRTYIRRNMSAADLLLTAVDPNLGFTGSSYRAANWQQWITIKARPYFYEHGRYVSPRQLRERYGTANIDELQARLPGTFQKSKVRLLDSMIFCCSVNEKTKVVPAHEMHRLHR